MASRRYGNGICPLLLNGEVGWEIEVEWSLVSVNDEVQWWNQLFSLLDDNTLKHCHCVLEVVR